MHLASMADAPVTVLDPPLKPGAEPSFVPPQRTPGKSLLRIALDVALISVGVFLGLLAQQWRESADHRELAQESLRRFRSEFQTNRSAVAGVKDKHVDGLKGIREYYQTDSIARVKLPLPFDGTNPAFLEYTAWDVAIATQSLAYVDPDLAQAISHVYAVQRQLDNSTRTITEVMYAKAGSPDTRSFLASMAIYFSDCELIEPRLLALYDEIIPRLNTVLGESGAARSTAR